MSCQKRGWNMTVGRTERCRGWIDNSQLPVWRNKRSGTHSQWRLLSAGVMCSDRRILKISQTTAFWTNKSRTCSGVPVCWSTEHQGPTVEIQWLRSWLSDMLAVPTSNLSTVSYRAFPIAAAQVWNTLSPNVRSYSSVNFQVPAQDWTFLMQASLTEMREFFVTFVRWPRSFGLCYPNLIRSVIIIIIIIIIIMTSTRENHWLTLYWAYESRGGVVRQANCENRWL